MDILEALVRAQKSGKTIGIASICSAHPLVLEAAFRHATVTGSPVLIEATSNQVNQLGGYTGMAPADFVQFVHAIAAEVGFPTERLILGGDHLGPLPFAAEPAETAMEKARAMVREYALSGFTKIHLDCSVSCADDRDLTPEIMAQRTAVLAAMVEEACRSAGLAFPRYVIGTEVPAAGGEKAGQEALRVTLPADAARTINLTQAAFADAGLEAAWKRVIALVVQPGVEFGHASIHEYDRPAAAALVRSIESVPNLVFEAHSTDYQTRSALQQLVQDHFAILKVGPGLTFAMREAIFALAEIEDQICETPSGIRERMESLMLANPVYWQNYYPGTPAEQKLNRQFSFSDRIRYYWAMPEALAALHQMLSNLEEKPIPLTLLSQYLPNEYSEVREGKLKNSPHELILRRIIRVLEDYASACGASMA
jgi:D-tagatose-1,6-bisphosphate aldolase subunit GatZ/KbaZ